MSECEVCGAEVVMSECEVCGADSYGAPTCSTCEWQQRAEKAEAERDTATAWAKVQQDALVAVTRERDEARAKCAALREALATIERTGAPGATIVAQRDEGHSCSWCRGMVTPCPTATARAALAETGDEGGK